MVAKTRSIVDMLYPAFQLACFLAMGAALYVFGFPLLTNVLGDDFLDFLSSVSQNLP